MQNATALFTNVVEGGSQKFMSRMLHRSARWLTCARYKPYRLHKVTYNT